MRTAMDVYHELCRLCCCCCAGVERRAGDDGKDVDYVLHDANDSTAAPSHQHANQHNRLRNAASTSTLKAKSDATGSVTANSGSGGVTNGGQTVAAGENSAAAGNHTGEEDSHLLKEARSSSLKTELYRQIWQRRVLWFGQTLPSFEGRRAVEFWSGWNARRTSGTTEPSPNTTSSTSHRTNSCRTGKTDGSTAAHCSAARRKKYHLTPEVSIESLQPELYAQTSIESTTEASSIDAGIGGCGGGDVDLNFDGPIESTPLGQIHFSLVYDDHKKVLTVKIVEACHLPPPKASGDDAAASPTPLHSNPYVRVYLLPDQRDGRQTPVQRKTQSPVFNHCFAYEMPHRDALKRTLMLKVLDLDKATRRHRVIGQVLLALAELNLIKGVHVWKRIRPATDTATETSELGELLISLTYLPSARRLNLDLLRGKQLLQTHLGGSAPYVRVSLVVAGKHVKTKRSSRKRNTMDPVWGETLSFNVASGELPESSLVVSVWDYNGGIVRDYFVGRIVLSAKEPSGDEELSHWNCILRDERTSPAQWHALRTREECDQASSASTAVS